MNTLPDRIPYAAWINSQLSIARHYGGIKIQGEFYVVEPPGNDLVKQMPKPKRRNRNASPERPSPAP
jgi:hypothetical protein